MWLANFWNAPAITAARERGFVAYWYLYHQRRAVKTHEEQTEGHTREHTHRLLVRHINIHGHMALKVIRGRDPSKL